MAVSETGVAETQLDRACCRRTRQRFKARNRRIQQKMLQVLRLGLLLKVEGELPLMSVCNFIAD